MSDPLGQDPIAPKPKPPPPDYGRLGKTLILLITLLAVPVGVYHTTEAHVNPDELEHLHAAWLWQQGVKPYTGFFEHHPPLYWMVLRPLVHSVTTQDLHLLVMRGRLLALLVAGAAVAASWWLFSTLFGRPAAWWGMAFAACSCALCPSTFEIRPDGASLLPLIVGSTLAINGCGAGLSRTAPSGWRAWAGGLVLATSVCLLTKALFWVLTLGVSLCVFCLVETWRQNRTRCLIPAALLAVGAAVPVALQLAWVFLANDLRAFWYCNVTANSELIGVAAASREGLRRIGDEAFKWPLLSVPLAVVGFGHLMGAAQPGAWIQKLAVSLMVLAGVAVVLLGTGPWPQYQLQLLWMTAGLAGAGAAAVGHGGARRAAVVAGGTMLIVSGFVFFVFVQCNDGVAELGPAHVKKWASYIATGREDPSRPGLLKRSLQPLQLVLDKMGPDDRFITLQGWNPVFMMDADPRLFMKPICLVRPETYDDLSWAVFDLRPRFIIGVGTKVWTREGYFADLSVGPEFLRFYRQFDGDDFVLERVE